MEWNNAKSQHRQKLKTKKKKSHECVYKWFECSFSELPETDWEDCSEVAQAVLAALVSVKLTFLGVLHRSPVVQYAAPHFQNHLYHNCIFTLELWPNYLSRCLSLAQTHCRAYLPLNRWSSTAYQRRTNHSRRAIINSEPGNLCELNALKLIIIIRYMVAASLSDTAYQVAPSLSFFLFSFLFIHPDSLHSAPPTLTC